ncbi:transcriptional regulator, TetR family [Bifidobacterium bohemicum]|uniref:TetR family transcriptional regulator n=1 Tax=Bifidobacterium bohemicum DSM 22767 TaxID=1437606 RepID=A0A086ZJD3_9BIFI|nr:TetR/AcrR family transcriptional regulator [Bifidobacterium bohemicum]KFI46633.1 TetR family transcriptional regulator [Bifidobacterium bohemicum DSM 22767]SCB77286.1 transcriptional regulator, TetR family [Bifidobacterium bohemicum]
MARPRSFDEHDVIEQCSAVFCTHGYEATSIDDLTAATGLKRGSLYQAFGSKHGLFVAALGQSLEEEEAACKPDSALSDSQSRIKQFDGRPERLAPNAEERRPAPTLNRRHGRPSVQDLTLIAIACLELAPNDRKVRGMLIDWVSKLNTERQSTLPEALGRCLLDRSHIHVGQPDE